MRSGGFFNLYQMYFTIRTRFVQPPIIKNSITYQYIAQILPLLLCFLRPSEIFNTTKTSSFFHYYESMMLFLPWVFGSESMFFDSLFYLLINIASFVILFFAALSSKKKKYINYWVCAFVSIFQYFYAQAVSFPLFFRFSYLLEQIIFNANVLTQEHLISFVIVIINILLNGFHIYLASVYLMPIDFVHLCNTDFFDGKNFASLYYVRFILASLCFFFTYLSGNVFVFVVIGLSFLICFLTTYIRMTSRTHTSNHSQFFEVFPIFSAPFMMVMKYYNQTWVMSLLAMLALFFVCIILTSLNNKFLIKQALKSFSPFMKKDEDQMLVVDSSQEQFPAMVFGSIKTLIRVVAAHHCDPECLRRFLKQYKKSSPKNSCLLEVIRFLALFPSKRAMCLRELEVIQSKSAANGFTIFRFRKILKGLSMQTNEKHRATLDELYRSFLVHQHLYWKMRRETRWCDTFKEACLTAFFHIEITTEFRALLSLFPYDHALHHYYSEFLLVANGDFEGYNKELQLANQLENQNCNKRSLLITDPLLHPMSTFNPRILQFCPKEDIDMTLFTSSAISSAFGGGLYQSVFSSESEKKKNIKDAKVNRSNPIATFLNMSKRPVPFLIHFHVHLPLILFLAIIFLMLPLTVNISDSISQLYEQTLDTVREFYAISSGLFLPYCLSTVENDSDCKTTFLQIPFHCIEAYSDIRLLSNLTGGMIYIYERYISNKMNEDNWQDVDESDLCDIIEGAVEDVDKMILSIFNEHSQIMHESLVSLNQLESYYKGQYSVYDFVTLTSLAVLVFGLISFIILCFQLNLIHSDEEKIDYFCREERLSLLLLQEGKKAWELFRQYVQTSDASTDNSTSIEHSATSSQLDLLQYPKVLNSSFNQGDNQQLRNSAFSLLSPSTTANSIATNGSNLTLSNNSFNLSNNKIVISNSQNVLNMNDDNFDENTEQSNNSQYNQRKDSQDERDERDEELSDDHDQKPKQPIKLSHLRSQTEALNQIHALDPVENETEIVTHAIQTSLSSGYDFAYCNIVLLMILPLVLFTCISLSFLMPIKSRTLKQLAKQQKIFNIQQKVNASFLLMNYSYSSTMGRFPDAKEVILVEIILKKTDFYESAFYTDLYWTESCYHLDSIVCMSIESIVQILKESPESISFEKMTKQYLPILYLFSQQILRSIYFPEVLDIYRNEYSNGASFIIAVILFMLSFSGMSFMSSSMMLKAFNSLFHFPEEFLKIPKEKKKSKLMNSEEYFPENAISVNSITETDEIYSVSENTKTIINKTLNDLISLKLSKIFPIVNEKENICEFTMTDKKKKFFRYSTENVGLLTKTTLVEEISPIQNPREKTYAQRLVEYIPPFFAKQFGDNGISLFEYTNAFIVCCRTPLNVSYQITDKFINEVNHVAQNYSTMNIVHVDGEMVIIASVSNVPPIVILLFIRDLISVFSPKPNNNNNSNNSNKNDNQNINILKNKKSSNPISLSCKSVANNSMGSGSGGDIKTMYALTVDFLNEFNCSINNNTEEPFLEFVPSPNDFRFKLYHIDADNAAFSKRAAGRLPVLKSIAKKAKVMTNFTGDYEVFWKLPIQKLSADNVLSLF